MRSYVSTNVRCAAEVSFLDCVRPAFFLCESEKIKNVPPEIMLIRKYEIYFYVLKYTPMKTQRNWILTTVFYSMRNVQPVASLVRPPELLL